MSGATTSLVAWLLLGQPRCGEAPLRRKEDKAQARLAVALVVLAFLSSVLASVVSFKAIRAVDGLNALLDDARRPREKSLLPEGY